MSEIHTGSRALGSHSATSLDSMPASSSAVSWAAIFAGAAGAAALSMLLLILGTGLGFSTVSPWTLEGLDASTIGFAAILWLSFTQLAASGMGGYLAGRLRTKWTDVHIDEVYFRDTAHGFLTWAVASLLTVVVFTSVLGSIVGSSVSEGAIVTNGAMNNFGMFSGEGRVAESLSADEARKASAYGALWMFVVLLIGAFAASLMAVFGGRQRDA